MNAFGLMNSLVSVTRDLAGSVHTAMAQSDPELAAQLDLPRRQRFGELIARGFDTLLVGLARALGPPEQLMASAAAAMAPEQQGRPVHLGPQRPSNASSANSSAQSDEELGTKLSTLFIDLGGIFPKLAQVLSLRPDLIRSEPVLRKLRQVQENCKVRPLMEFRALVVKELPQLLNEYDMRVDDKWPAHAGSVAQVQYLFKKNAGPNDSPCGVVKGAWPDGRDLMEVDFRLMKTQLQWMDRLQNANLSTDQVRRLREVWAIVVGSEAEVLKEFDLRNELECQETGAFLLEGLLGEDCKWLQEWQNAALTTALKPLEKTGLAPVAKQASSMWSGSRPGMFQSMRQKVFGMPEPERRMKTVKETLAKLQIKVPNVWREHSSAHVMCMDLAPGKSLKRYLDEALDESAAVAEREDAQMWFTVLWICVIVPLWGKMLLEVGNCHADPHPGNFRFFDGKGAARGTPPSFWILDWGSIIEVPEATRRSLCSLIMNLARWRRTVQSEDEQERLTAGPGGPCVRAVAQTMRAIGCKDGPSGPNDDLLAAIAMSIFDPEVRNTHELLRGGGDGQDVFEQSFPTDSLIGKILRIIAILVGVCRSIQSSINLKSTAMHQDAQVDLFLVELWLAFAEEGIQ